MKRYLPVIVIAAALLGGIAPAQAQSVPAGESAAVDLVAQGADVTAIAETFIESLASGDYATALQSYDPAIRTTLTVESLAQQWNDLIASTGAYEGPVAATVDNSGDAPVVIMTGQFENGPRDLFILFNSNNQIISMDAMEF
ncbi:MAG TPA: DUF3887 domain-containing protein [Candidatus Obscuribacterales bacterium]